MIAEVMAVLHLGWDEIMALDVRWFCKLYNRIPIITARLMLQYMPLITYPHLISNSDRTKVYRRLERQARLPKVIVPEDSSGWSQLRRFSRE